MSRSLEEVKAEQGKMLLQMIGVLLVFTAVSVVFQGGVMLSVILGNSDASKEALQDLMANGFTRELLISVGTSYVILGVTQIVTGIFSFRLANRLDKLKIMKIVAIVFTAVSLLQQGYLFVIGVTSIFGWVSAILMPGILLWAMQKNVRLAKADPDRIYVIDPKTRKSARNQPQKTTNLRARANAKVKDEELAARVAREKPEETAKESVRYDDLEFVNAMNSAAETEESRKQEVSQAQEAEEVQESVEKEQVSETADAETAQEQPEEIRENTGEEVQETEETDQKDGK